MKNTSKQRFDKFPASIQWVCVVAGQLALKTLCRCLPNSAPGEHPGKGLILPHSVPCGAHLGPPVKGQQQQQKEQETDMEIAVKQAVERFK